MDFDRSALTSINGWKREAPTKCRAPYEMTHWYTSEAEAGRDKWRLNFSVPYWRVQGRPFDEIKWDEVAKAILDANPQAFEPAGDSPYSKGDIFILETNRGRYVKMQVMVPGGEVNQANNRRTRRLQIRYVVYEGVR